jgi:hypothetical protein
MYVVCPTPFSRLHDQPNVATLRMTLPSTQAQDFLLPVYSLHLLPIQLSILLLTLKKRSDKKGGKEASHVSDTPVSFEIRKVSTGKKISLLLYMQIVSLLFYFSTFILPHAAFRIIETGPVLSESSSEFSTMNQKTSSASLVLR